MLDIREPLKHNTPLSKLTKEKRTKIMAALVEGNSLRATARICDVAFNTVLKLLPKVSSLCADHQDKTLRNLKCKRIQCDEIWSFCHAKEKNCWQPWNQNESLPGGELPLAVSQRTGFGRAQDPLMPRDLES